jgi:hypothetical protein
MLSPRFQLRLGDRIYGPQVAGLVLRRTRLPAADRLEVRLPAGADVSAAPGDPVSLELDGGEGGATVFTGRLAVVRRRFDAIDLVARGGADRLARVRPVLALAKVSAGDAIRRLADAAGVEVAEAADGPSLAVYAVDGRATALAEVARLAAFTGATAFLDGEGRLVVADPAVPAAPLPLLYGREILEAEAAQGDESDPVPVVTGEGGDPGGEQARWIIADFNRGSPPAADAPRVAMPELRTRADAQAAAAAMAQASWARARAVRLTTFLIPAIAPGTRLSIAGMPETVGLAEATVHQVQHSVSADGIALTRVWGTGFTGRGGLLESLVGAVAGALS